MKIHIVQKGDTFWEIAKKYGMDIEQLKQLNPQIASPDMIMPGMKIKILSSTKPVKKEKVSIKETKLPVVKEEKQPIVEAKEKPKEVPKETAQEVPKEVKQKPLQAIKEDDHHKPKEVKVEMPFKQMPQVPQKVAVPKVNKPIKPIPKEEKKPMKEKIQLPVIEEKLQINLPEIPQYIQPTEKKPVMEQTGCAKHQHHCCAPVHHHYFPVLVGTQMPMVNQQVPNCHIQQMHHMTPNHMHLGHMTPNHMHQGHMAPNHMHQGHMAPNHMHQGHMAPNHMHQGHMAPNHMHQGHMAPNHMPLQQQHLMNAGDCGCESMTPYREPLISEKTQPLPFPPMDLEAVSYEPQFKEQIIQPNVQEYPTVPPNIANDPIHSIRNTYPTPPGYPSFAGSDNKEDADKSME